MKTRTIRWTERPDGWEVIGEGHKATIKKIGANATVMQYESEDIQDLLDGSGEQTQYFSDWYSAVTAFLEKVMSEKSNQEPRFSVVWSGKRVRDYSTNVREFMGSEDSNYVNVSLHVIDTKKNQMIHSIELPIDVKGGWSVDETRDAVARLSRELIEIIATHEEALLAEDILWGDIQVT